MQVTCRDHKVEPLKVSSDGVAAVHGDGGGGIIDIGDGSHIAGPVDKAITTNRSRHQIHYCPSPITESPLAGASYRTTRCAGDSQAVLDWWNDLEVGCDGVVTIHGNGGGRGIDVGNGAHVAGPVDKLVNTCWSRYQVDYGAGVICKRPLARSTHRTARAAGDGQAVLIGRYGRTLLEVGGDGYILSRHGEGGRRGTGVGE